jgi:hypothetical protein
MLGDECWYVSRTNWPSGLQALSPYLSTALFLVAVKLSRTQCICRFVPCTPSLYLNPRSQLVQLRLFTYFPKRFNIKFYLFSLFAVWGQGTSRVWTMDDSEPSSTWRFKSGRNIPNSPLGRLIATMLTSWYILKSTDNFYLKKKNIYISSCAAI